MFLTGQFYPRPWEEPNKPKPQPKDKNYFNNNDGLWNNPHRTGSKVAKFYQQKEQTFKKSHYTDQEIRNIQDKQIQFEKHQYSQEKRIQSRGRLNNRKTEREILQFKSDQHLEDEGIDQIGEIAVNEPELFDEMATKRAKSYKDPSRVKQPNMQLWNAINQLPSKQLSKILRPQIIEKDKNATELIMQKIENEKHIEQLQNQWFVQNRQNLRQKFIERHDKNIELEKKAGVKKEYQPILATNNVNTLNINQGSGVNLQQQQRPYSAYNANSSTQSSKQALFKAQNLLSHQQASHQQSEGQVTFRQKQQNSISKINQNDLDHIHEEVQDEQIQDASQTPSLTNFQNYITSNNLQGKRLSTQPNGYETNLSNQKQSEFRISTAVQPVFYRTNKTFEKLSQPKQQQEPSRPFMQSDFRGLFTADHQEALSNCNEYDSEKHSTYISQQIQDKKTKSNTVREFFPIPQGKTSNLLMASNSGVISIGKSSQLPYKTSQSRSRQQFSTTRQTTPFTYVNNFNLNPQLISSSSALGNNIESQEQMFSAHTTQGAQQLKSGLISVNGIITKSSALSVAGSQTPFTDVGLNDTQNGIRTAVTQSRLVKRPFTAYKAAISQRTGSAYGIRNQNPIEPYQDQYGSFNQSTVRNIGSSRQKQRLQQDILQAQQQLEMEKEECLSQMDWFEKVNHLDVKRQNKYPQIAYEEALNYGERFAEHLANKKGSPKKNDQPVETNQDNSNRMLNERSGNLILNKSQNSIRQVATPSGLSISDNNI